MRGPHLLVLAALALAGCASDEAPASPVAEAAAIEGAVVGADGTLLLPARFPASTPVDVTTWHNGTFSAQEVERPVPFLPGPSDLGLTPPTWRTIDITKDVPLGVPVRIIAQVDAPLQQGDLDLGLQVPRGEWRTGNWDTPSGGYSRVEAGIVHVSGEPISVVLAYDEPEPAAEVGYALSVRIVSDPELLVNGIVSGVTLPADAALAVELVGEKREREFEEIALMVYAPDDTYLGAFPLATSGATTIELPAGSPAGEYMMMLRQGGRNARLLVDGANGTAPLRAVAQEFVLDGAVAGDSSGHAKWSVDHARAPLLVGLEFLSPNAALNVAVKIDGPAGSIVDDRIEGGPWMSVRLPDGSSFSDGFGWDCGYGAPGLAAGTYTYEVTFDTAQGPDKLEPVSWAAFYVR